MIRIYKITKENLKEAKKTLEENPYDTESFARAGYKLREGKGLGMQFDGQYVYISAEENLIKKFDEKLKEKAEILSGEEFNKVKEAIEKEDENAVQGFGNIFG